MAKSRKEASRARILAAASRRLRAEGLDRAGVADIMGDAGLTHGGFYAHFADKSALVAAAFAEAMGEGRAAWTLDLAGLPPAEAHRRIVGRYLSRRHRDAPSAGCAMAALGSELGRQAPGMRRSFETELLATLAALAPHMPQTEAGDARTQAIATTALCLGGILLSRMVASEELSDEILLACRRWALAAAP